MKLLAIDIGSSSIKAAVLTNGGDPRRVVRAAFPTRYNSSRAEVLADDIEKALRRVIDALDTAARTVGLIVSTTMAPSWLAMDRHGKAITPIVTHQDRRAVVEAHDIEKQIGKARHLRLAGNRPFPGGISSTTWAWFNRHERTLMKRADLVGHLSTWLARTWCGVRVTDPSNAGFMGVYNAITLKGWSDELLSGAGGKQSLLPDVMDANQVAGTISQSAASRFGLRGGTPMLTGCMDGSAAMLATGAAPGQLLNVCGSTDVLALVVDRPKPHEDLLTRPLGIARKWLAVGTLAAAGTAIDWARKLMYSDLAEPAFYKHLGKLDLAAECEVKCVPHLAGMRTAMNEQTASLNALRLGTTRDDVLRSICQGLAEESMKRLKLLKSRYRSINRNIVFTGGVPDTVATMLRRNWRLLGNWRYRAIDNATLGGLWQLANMTA